MYNLIITGAKYFSSWLLMLMTLFIALFAESIHVYLSGKSMGKHGYIASLLPVREIYHSMFSRIVLPETACFTLSVYCPGLAFAALIPICASIPFFSFVSILDNGGDMMQILQFAMLSETFALVSVFSLGTSGADRTAHRMVKELIRLMLPLMACFSSIAYYLAIIGVDGDTFSLNAFTLSLHLVPSAPYALAGMSLFVFVIFSQIPHSNSGFGCSVFERGELPEYRGCPRGILQLWSVFRAFLVVALVTHIFFPWSFFKGLNAGFSISWWAQTINFFAFWAAVIFVRVFGVTLSWKAMDALEKLLPCEVQPIYLRLVLILTAMAMIMYEGIRISLEAATF